MSKKLHEALGDWRSSATNVKSRIYAETIEGNKIKKSYPTYMKIAATAAVLVAGVSGAMLFTKEPTNTPIPAVEKNTDLTEEKATTFRPISEAFLKIEQYESFYRENTMYTQEGAVSSALRYAINYYTLFNHTRENGLYWDEKKRDFFRNSCKNALDSDLEDPSFMAYFEKMLSELSITKEQYIEDYLLVKMEYEMLQSEMSRTGVGLKDGAYESSIAEDKFMKQMGLTFDYIEYLFVRNDESLTPLDPQPTLSFNKDADDYSVKVTKNLAGEYVFVNAEPSLYNMPSQIEEYLRQFMYDNRISYFSRYSYPIIKTHVEQEAVEGNDIAQQTLDYFTILERSVDWEFTAQPFAFNNIPTFQLENLRTHSDLTLKIAEYELYHKDPSIYAEYVAYRYANELVADMYGLFNYLSQDYGYGWSAETRAEYAESLTLELEASIQNEPEKSYVENLLQEFNITLDDYIKYYLLPKKEYELLLQAMQKDKVGIDENGRFNPGEQSSRYRETIDLTWQKLFDTMDEKAGRPIIEELASQPELPFALHPIFPITVGLNKAGEYVLEYPTIEESLTDEQKTLYLEIQAKHNLPPIARYSVHAYIKQAQLLSSQTAKELVEIFTLFDRTVN